jgi:ligand-binding sensor domain-containing protein/signal transduction histidine kinase
MRSAWGSDKGFSGPATAIAQTADGYLWIGTEKGLVRFDGLNFRTFDQANSAAFSIGGVQKLLADDEGNLWILLRDTRLLRYHDGIFELSRGEAENGITALGRGATAPILLSSVALGTLTYKRERFATVSSALVLPDSALDGNVPDDRSTRLSWSTGLAPHRLAAPNADVTSIAQSADGKIWLGTEDRGLFYLNDGKIYAAKGTQGTRIRCLLPTEKSQLWIGTSHGVMRWNGVEVTRSGVPSSLLNVTVLAMIQDRDSNIWMGTRRGLLRFNPNHLSSLAKTTRAMDLSVTALFEDREGNIWIGGPRGLERLRDRAFITYEVPGRLSQSVGPVYVDSGDGVWFAPMEGGLLRLKGGKSEPLQIPGLGQDVVYSIAGRGNDLWLGQRHSGLTHLQNDHGSFRSKTFTYADGLAQNSVYAVYEGRDGTVWAGTLSGGVSKLYDGHFTTYTTANGLAADTVSSIAEDADGTMWFGTPKGLTQMSRSGWRTYTARDGLSSPDVNCLLRDSDGTLWIGTAAGLAMLAGDEIQVFQNAPESLHEPIFGIAEDKDGWLWIVTAGHVLQAKRSSLVSGSLNQADVREFGIENGLLGTEGVKRFRSVVTDSPGQVWISTNHGLSVVNPVRVAMNSVPALIHIEAVLADGMPLELKAAPRIPASKRRITFRYMGLSLNNSERVRYRYKLDGFDHGWSEPVTNVEATYGNLGAGSYTFHVMASNGDGLWNGSEAAIGFEVEPALWQTWWFRLGCVLTVGLTTLLIYRARMRRVTELLRVRFEERLAERTRIAHELHDTLLQGLLSMSMHLHVAIDQLPEDSPARATMNRIMELMGPVIQDGRNTIRGLRSSIQSANDLVTSFSRIPLELGDKGVNFRVIVEGMSVPLRPAIRDEVYRIGREALVNAFRHSRARNINLHLEYATDHLRIFVEDDGCGIDSQVLHSGRDGHWGLSGMRERAENIGGKLRIMSRLGGGTEVELRLASQLAFESPPSSLASKWLARFHHRQKERELTPR